MDAAGGEANFIGYFVGAILLLELTLVNKIHAGLKTYHLEVLGLLGNPPPAVSRFARSSPDNLMIFGIFTLKVSCYVHATERIDFADFSNKSCGFSIDLKVQFTLNTERFFDKKS